MSDAIHTDVATERETPARASGGASLASAAIPASASTAAPGLGRRHFIAGGVASAALIGALARAASAEDAATSGQTTDLSALSQDCVATGEACLAHCIQMLSTGDTTMAGCARSVHEMMAVCGALSRLAATESTFLPALAAVCRDVCAACERECEKHAKSHAVCAACGEACKKLGAALAGIASA